MLDDDVRLLVSWLACTDDDNSSDSERGESGADKYSGTSSKVPATE
jgi:hypothetical protein